MTKKTETEKAEAAEAKTQAPPKNVVVKKTILEQSAALKAEREAEEEAKKKAK